MARTTLLAFLICLCASQGYGQFSSQRSQLAWQNDGGEPHFSGDYACFRLDDTLTYTELYFQIPFANLRFVRCQGGYQAEYEIELYVEDDSGALAYCKDARDKIKVASYDETVAAQNARAIMFTAYLRPGVHRLRAIATDRETGRSAEARAELQVRDFRQDTLQISDLQFSSNIEVNASATDFVKNHRRVEPNVTRTYGKTTPCLFVYYEIYNLAFDCGPDSFHTTITIQRDDGRIITQLKRYVRKPGASCVQSLCLPIADFPRAEVFTRSSDGRCGAYRLKIEITDAKTGQRAESSSERSAFTIYRQDFASAERRFELLDPMSYGGFRPNR